MGGGSSPQIVKCLQSRLGTAFGAILAVFVPRFSGLAYTPAIVGGLFN